MGSLIAHVPSRSRDLGWGGQKNSKIVSGAHRLAGEPDVRQSDFAPVPAHHGSGPCRDRHPANIDNHRPCRLETETQAYSTTLTEPLNETLVDADFLILQKS